MGTRVTVTARGLSTAVSSAGAEICVTVTTPSGQCLIRVTSRRSISEAFVMTKEAEQGAAFVKRGPSTLRKDTNHRPGNHARPTLRSIHHAH